jgi:hypothetical protein
MRLSPIQEESLGSEEFLSEENAPQDVGAETSSAAGIIGTNEEVGAETKFETSSVTGIIGALNFNISAAIQNILNSKLLNTDTKYRY